MNLWNHTPWWPCGTIRKQTLYYCKWISIRPLMYWYNATLPTWGHVPNPQGYNCHFRLLCFINLYKAFQEIWDAKHTNQEREIEREMGVMSLSSMMVLLLQVMIMLGQEIGKVSSTVYKVGDLDSWGIPTDAKVYSKWPKSHSFKIGDSLCKYSNFNLSNLYNSNL